MPGIVKGIDPSNNPNTIPIKTATRLRSSKSFTAFPTTFYTFAMADSSPTTVNRSPNCNVKSGVGNNTIPAR